MADEAFTKEKQRNESVVAVLGLCLAAVLVLTDCLSVYASGAEVSAGNGTVMSGMEGDNGDGVSDVGESGSAKTEDTGSVLGGDDTAVFGSGDVSGENDVSGGDALTRREPEVFYREYGVESGAAGAESSMESGASGMEGSAAAGGVGRTVRSDSFILYEEGAFDLIPRIAAHYGVELDTVMADMQMQDVLTRQGNLIFIRNPQNTAPYVAGELSDYWRSVIDGLLLGRAQYCEFGFEPVNLNTGNFYMEQTDAAMPDISGDFAITRQYNSMGAGYAGSLGLAGILLLTSVWESFRTARFSGSQGQALLWHLQKKQTDFVRLPDRLIP